MATIGQQLLAPETGWRRYDDSDSRIVKVGTGWLNDTNTYNYNSSCNYKVGSEHNFKFKGTKLRIIQMMLGNASTDISVSIDGIIEHYSAYKSSNQYQSIVYEKSNLTNGVHSVIIKSLTGASNGLDAIDIDDIGYLLHPTLNQVASLNTMGIGDCIPCRYTATTSGVAGYFSELGICIANEIPIAGTATPDGLCYLIKTDKGTLIADRVIQTNISWDALNINGLIEGASNKPQSISTASINAFSGGFYNSGNFNYSVPIANKITFNSTNGSYGQENFKPDATVSNSSKINFKILTMTDNARLDLYFYSKTYGKSVVLVITPNQIGISSSVWNPYDINIIGKDIVVYCNFTNNTIYVAIDGVMFIYKKITPASISADADYSFLCAITSSNTAQTIQLEYYKYVPNSLGVVHNINRGLIRSMSGGCAYADADANGNMSLTDKSLGAWPTNNEWDKYIVNSDLKGKIAKGDDNVWHYTPTWSWCKETGINGLISASVPSGGNSTNRIFRGYLYQGRAINRLDNIVTSNANVAGGFRPVLNYVESDIVSEVIY